MATLLTKTRPLTRARSMRRSSPSTKASRAPTTSAGSMPRSRAKWFLVPAGMHTYGRSCSAATAATAPCDPSPPAMPMASAPACTAATASAAGSSPRSNTIGSMPRARHWRTSSKRSALPPPERGFTMSAGAAGRAVIGGLAGALDPPRPSIGRPLRCGRVGNHLRRDGLEVTGSRLEVLGQQVDGQVCVAGEGGVADRLVLLSDVDASWVVRKAARPHSIQLGGVVELAPYPFEDGAASAGRQGGVEAGMGGEPLGVGRAVVQEHRCGGEAMVGGHEVGFPRHVAFGNRLAQRQPFDLDPHPG